MATRISKDFKTFFQNKYHGWRISTPHWHFVLGSLIGTCFQQIQAHSIFNSWEQRGELLFSDVPGLPVPKTPHHLGCYQYFVHKTLGHSICFQLGRLHGYENLSPFQVVLPVTAPLMAGTSRFVLSNIGGSLHLDRPIGTVVAISDHINWTGQSPLPGPDILSYFARRKNRFLDMAHAYHPQLTEFIIKQLNQHQLQVSTGRYVGVLGPQFETPAEIEMFSKMGADVVGMSTVWEVIALHDLEARVGAVSVISNLACGVGKSTDIDTAKLQVIFKKLIQSFLALAETQEIPNT